MRTVEWDAENRVLNLIDQRLLPGEFKIVSYQDHRQVAQAIREMVVRGAPAIGATAGFGLALAAQESSAIDRDTFLSDLQTASNILTDSRPTAANLHWALQRIMREVKKSKIIVRPFILRSFEEVTTILNALREGYTIAVIDIKPLKKKDIIELKRAISKIKKTADALEGDIAGFGDGTIIVTPQFAEIAKIPAAEKARDVDLE